MATLYFKIGADYENVIRLRDEIKKLENQLRSFGKSTPETQIRQTEERLATTRQEFMRLTTEAAKAGAVMENDLKRKINSVTKASDELSEEIIKQRKIIRDTQDDVRRLSEQYSKMGKLDPKATSTLNQLNRAKAALGEQKYALGDLQDQQARNRLELRQLTREYRDFSQGTDKATVAVDALMSSLKRTAAEIGGLAAIRKFGMDVIDATGKMQQLQVALSTILQSKSKADALLAEISEFAKKTPFNLDDVANGAKQLLAYGSSAETVVDELSMLGDVAAGLQIPIGQLIYLYGTLRTQGRAMTVDIRQFAGRGIPIYEELAKVLGVTKDQVGELVTAGKVGFKEVEQAFKNMTSEGGKFNNLMENSAGTWPQRISNIEDVLFQKLNDFGNKYKEVFEFGIGTAEELVEHLDDVISVIGGLVAAYGTYKAALIATAVAQKAVGFVESIRLIMSYRKQLGLATAAQQAFNFAAKSNVYVALLSVLVGLGTAVYMFTKRTDEATEAQKKLSKAGEAFSAQVSQERAEIDRLFDNLKNAKEGTEEYQNAKDVITDKYGTYLNGLGEEIRTLKDVEGAYEAVTKAALKAARARGMDAAMNDAQSAYGERYGKNAQRLFEMMSSYVGEKEAKSYLQEVRKQIDSTGKISGELRTEMAGLFSSPREHRTFLSSIKEMEQATSELKEAYKQVEAAFGEEEGSVVKEPTRFTISKEISNVTERIRTLKKEISELRSGKLQAEAGKTVESTIKEKVKELNSAQETLETLTGEKPKTVKQENAVYSQQAHVLELERKQARERVRQMQDMEAQAVQARIEAMDDGFDKEKAKMELNHQKELQEIGRQRQDYVNAVIQMEKEAFDAKEKLKASKDKNYRIKTFDYSSVSVDTSAFDIMGGEVRKRQKKEMADFYKDALSDYQDYTTKYKAALDKFEKDRKDLVNAGATDEQLKELEYQKEETLKAINEEFAGREEAFNAWADNVVDLSLGKLRELLNAAYQEMMNMEISDPDNANLSTLRAKVGKLRDAISQKELEKEISPGKATKDWDKLYDVLSEVDDVFKEIGDTVDGTLGEIISMAGEAASGSMQLAGAIKGVGEATEGLEKASAILAAISAAMKVVSGISGFFKEQFGADYSGYEEMKSRYDTLISVWDELIDKKMEYIDIDYGVEAQKAADEAAQLVNANILRNRQLAHQLRSSGASIGSHSLGVRVSDRMSDADWSRLSDLVGSRVGSLEDVLNLDADVIGDTLKDERFVSVLTEVNSEFIDYINNISDYADQLDEIAEKEKEALTGIGLDEFKSGYVDMLSDLDATNEDFADNFEKYLQNAVFSALVADKYKDRIEALYEQWSADADSGGKLTADEAERLREENNAIIEDMLAERENIMNAFGWESSSETSAQQASSSVKVNASQESIDELSGRALAIQETGLQILTQETQQGLAITDIKGNVTAISASMIKMENIGESVRDILADSYLELVSIRENTSAIIKPIQQMQADIEQVRRNTDRL